MSATPARFKLALDVQPFADGMKRVVESTNRLATWLDSIPADPEPTPLHDALRELPTANPLRAHYLRDRIAELSGGVA